MDFIGYVLIASIVSILVLVPMLIFDLLFALIYKGNQNYLTHLVRKYERVGRVWEFTFLGLVLCGVLALFIGIAYFVVQYLLSVTTDELLIFPLQVLVSCLEDPIVLFLFVSIAIVFVKQKIQQRVRD